MPNLPSTVARSKGKPTTFRVYFTTPASLSCALRVCVTQRVPKGNNPIKAVLIRSNGARG